ncbi:MAG: sensor domain-containing diguanylate cyclase [Firmicutes bacterium]|nr:sensor domain-containing diguanylate cyclase [Bacillota bacterium]
MRSALSLYWPFPVVVIGLVGIFFFGGLVPVEPSVLSNLYFIPIAASAVTASAAFVSFTVAVAGLLANISLGRVDLILWTSFALVGWLALYAVYRQRDQARRSQQEYQLLAEQHVACQEHFDNYSNTLIRKNHELEKKVAELSTLYGLSTSVTTTTDLKKIYLKVCDAVSKLCAYDSFVFFETGPTPQALVAKETSGLFSPWRIGDIISYEHGLIGHYAALGQMALIEDVKQQALTRPTAEEEWFRSLMIVPVAVHNQLLAVLVLARAEQPAFSRNEFYIIQSLASQIGAAIHRSLLYRRLEEMANTDELTGLCNRRQFEETLRHEFARAARYQQVLTVALLDVDHFKHYNDTHGHLAGDRLLQEVGAIIKESIREVDLAARYGGEEFVLVLPNTTAEEAHHVVERIRTRIRQLAMPGAEEQPLGHFSVSIGLAAYPQDAADAESLLNCADIALYKAKELGRDRTVYYAVGSP